MLKIKLLAAALATLLIATVAHAGGLTVGESLVEVVIDQGGELYLADEKVQYKSWDSRSMAGKVGVVQHLAARQGADKKNKPLMDALEKAAFPLDKFLVTTVVNIDDAMWGTSGLVNSELKKNKERYPASVIVADDDGVTLTAWGLQKKNSAIAVLDAEGTVVFFKEGALNDQEITEVLAMIGQLL